MDKQILEDFYLKMTRFEGNLVMFWNEGIRRWQKWLNFTMSKIVLIGRVNFTVDIFWLLQFLNHSYFAKRGPFFFKISYKPGPF